MRVGINGQLLSFREDYRQAGVSRYIDALLRYLPKCAPDDEFVVFTGAHDLDLRNRYDPGIEWIVSTWQSRRPEARIVWEQTAGQILGKRHRLDLLHSPVNVAPLAARIPQVVTVHDLAFEHFPEQYPRSKARYLQAMTRKSVNRANRIIAVSNATKHDLISLYGAAPHKVTVISNGVSDDMFPRSREATTVLRRRHNLPENFFLFVGTLQPRKNLEGLLQALALLPSDLDWPLVVIGGSGWMDDPIHRTVRRSGISERVRFIGYVPGEDLPYWYSAAAILVMPSFYEGFGLPVLEAMACGTPTIVANTPALTEVAGSAALRIEPTQPRSIAREMLRLASDPALQQELTTTGLARAHTYSWRRTAEETRSVYSEVTGA